MRAARGSLAWPFLIGLIVLVGIPAAGTIALALTDFTGLRAPAFVGVDNFVRLARSDAFWRGLGNSSVYVALAVPLRIGAAVSFALLLHVRAPGLGTARTAAYLPTVVPDAAYALLWLWILNPLFGPLNLALGATGLPEPQWLTEPWAARVGIAVMGAFQIGEAFVVALVARRTIPGSLYEAATLDGASPWFILRRVTLPLMAPILALLVMRDVIVAFQATFVPALLVTDGGPRYATTYLPLLVYRQAFTYFRFGYASAIATTMFAVTAAAIYLQYRLARRWRLFR